MERRSLRQIGQDLSTIAAMLSDLATEIANLPTVEAVVLSIADETFDKIAAKPLPSPDEVLGILAEDKKQKDSERDKASSTKTRDGSPRMRSAPYNRIRREAVVKVLLAELADGEWHNAVHIAKKQSRDPDSGRRSKPKYSYLRSQYSTRLLELHREGKLERRVSELPGVELEYKLLPEDKKYGH